MYYVGRYECAVPTNGNGNRASNPGSVGCSSFLFFIHFFWSSLYMGATVLRYIRTRAPHNTTIIVLHRVKKGWDRTPVLGKGWTGRTWKWINGMAKYSSLLRYLLCTGVPIVQYRGSLPSRRCRSATSFLVPRCNFSFLVLLLLVRYVGRWVYM